MCFVSLLQLLVVARNPWSSLVYRHMAPISAFNGNILCVFVSRFPCFCEDTSHTARIRPTLIRYDIIQTWLHLRRPYFQIRSFSQVQRLGLHHVFFEGGTQFNCTLSIGIQKKLLPYRQIHPSQTSKQPTSHLSHKHLSLDYVIESGFPKNNLSMPICLTSVSVKE